LAYQAELVRDREQLLDSCLMAVHCLTEDFPDGSLHTGGVRRLETFNQIILPFR
jgi:hypothetical protein